MQYKITMCIDKTNVLVSYVPEYIQKVGLYEAKLK